MVFVLIALGTQKTVNEETNLIESNRHSDEKSGISNKNTSTNTINHIIIRLEIAYKLHKCLCAKINTFPFLLFSVK